MPWWAAPWPVLLDGGLPEEQVQAVLEHILAVVPRTRRRVLAESGQQQASGILAGADETHQCSVRAADIRYKSAKEGL